MTELRIERTIPASPERVWRAFTSELGAWLWPAAWNAEATADVRVGGTWRIAASSMAVGGEFVAVDEPHRLVQTWRWDGDDEETLVTIILDPVAGGTALTLVHERFVTDEDRDNHLQGWDDCLERLAPYLS